MGAAAEDALREWDSPEMEEYRDELFDDIFRELSEEEAEMGQQANIESAELTQIACIMLGDRASDLEVALKTISLFAAEKGVSLEKSPSIKTSSLVYMSVNQMRVLKVFAKELMQTSSSYLDKEKI